MRPPSSRASRSNASASSSRRSIDSALRFSGRCSVTTATSPCGSIDSSPGTRPAYRLGDEHALLREQRVRRRRRPRRPAPPSFTRTWSSCQIAALALGHRAGSDRVEAGRDRAGRPDRGARPSRCTARSRGSPTSLPVAGSVGGRAVQLVRDPHLRGRLELAGVVRERALHPHVGEAEREDTSESSGPPGGAHDHLVLREPDRVRRLPVRVGRSDRELRSTRHAAGCRTRDASGGPCMRFGDVHCLVGGHQRDADRRRALRPG